MVCSIRVTPFAGMLLAVDPQHAQDQDTGETVAPFLINPAVDIRHEDATLTLDVAPLAHAARQDVMLP